MPHESWAATQILLGAVALVLFVIAIACCDTKKAPDDMDIDDNNPGGTG